MQRMSHLLPFSRLRQEIDAGEAGRMPLTKAEARWGVLLLLLSFWTVIAFSLLRSVRW